MLHFIQLDDKMVFLFTGFVLTSVKCIRFYKLEEASKYTN